MNRPSLSVYVVGHPVGALALTIAAGVLGYQWWHGEVGDFAPFMSVIMIGIAIDANQKITEYSDWKRAWDAMEGNAPRKRFGWLNTRLLVVLWVLTGVGAMALDVKSPASVWLVLAFLALTLFLGCRGLYRLARRRRNRPEKPRPKDPPVTLALAVPRASPDRKQLYKGLPGYCGKL